MKCMDMMATPTEPQSEAIDGAFCPNFHRAVELIGRRWTGAIVRALLRDVVHFSDLARVIPDLSDRMLSERLKELEAEGIVARTVIPATPVRVEYRLTEKGRALEPVLDAISQWAGEWLVAPPDDSERCPALAAEQS
jgi:DNA-binding HxlR family transcriptional regulator